MFHIEIPNREYLIVDGQDVIKLLKCKFKQTAKEKPVDELEEYITNIFENKTSNNDDIAEEGNDAKTVKVMNDEYVYSLPSTSVTEDTPISSEILGGSVSELGLSDQQIIVGICN